MAPASETVKVVVRCRPLNSKEKADGRNTIVDMDPKTGQVALRNPAAEASEAPKTFTFDAAYDANCTQEEIYEQSAKPIVHSVMQGYNGACQSATSLLVANLGGKGCHEP